MKVLLLFFPLFFWIAPLFGQVVQVTSSVIPEVLVCGNSASPEYRIYNNGATPLQNLNLQLDLPTGISYVPSSLNESTNQNVQEQNVSNLSSLSFSSGNLAAGDSLVFSISYEANVPSVAFQTAGGLFRDTLNLSFTGGSQNHISNSYNILYPAISILSVSPNSQSIWSGGTTTRSIQLINGGNGKTDRILLSDIRNAGNLSLDGVDIGQLNGDTLILSGSDFQSVGNGDSYLDQNESITVTETLSGSSCSNTTVSSEIRAHWGCEGQLVTGSTSFAHVSIDFESPNLMITSVETLDDCFGTGAPSAQQLIIRNTGRGVASGITVDVFKSTGAGYNQDIYSRIDPASLRYKIGANGSLQAVTSLNTLPTQSSGGYSCLGTNPVGRANFTVSNLAPGDTIFVTWDMYACCPTLCQNDVVKGWSADVAYSDICAVTPYSASLQGQERNDQYLSYFTESPINMQDGVSEVFDFIVSSFENTLPVGPQSAYKAVFSLDPDLDFESLSWNSNSVEWIPLSLNYDSLAHIVEVWYPAVAPFTIPKSTMALELSGDCGNSGWKNIELDVFYYPDTTCNGCGIPMACDVQTDTYLNCPVGNCSSLEVLGFEVQRVNFGEPDNNLDGNPDGSGNLDLQKIKVNRAMVGDTLLASSTGVVGNTTNSWDYAGFTSSIDYGSVLEIVDATVTVYDFSGSTSFVVSGLTPVLQTSGNQRDFYYDLSVANLISLNPALAGYSFASGDSIRIECRYRVAASVISSLKESTWLNEFFLSAVANPSAAQKESCNFKHARLTLIGYSWRNDVANNVTVNACSKNLVQNFGMSIGDLGSNYGGGNLFPYEYRHWGSVKSARLILPADYSPVTTTLKYYPTKKTNSTYTITLNNLSPDAISGDTLYYDLAQYFATSQLPYSDDGWNGKLTVEVAPKCDVPVNIYENVHWLFNYQTEAILGGNETGDLAAASPDKIRYRPSSFSLQSGNPRQDVITQKVIWDYKVQNTSSNGADYAWVHLQTPANIVIDSVGQDGAALLTKQNDLYLIGSVNSGSTADLSIYATVTNCDTAMITAFSGFECTGYPTDFGSFTCNYQQLDLYVEPKDAGFQTVLSTSSLQNPCSPEIELVLDVTSVKLAHMYNMAIDLISPDTQKIKVKSGSSEFQYNISNPYSAIADPFEAAGLYHYEIDDYVASFPDYGIPGVLDFNNNRYRLKMTIELGSQFVNGDILEIEFSGTTPCGDSVTVVRLAVDPNSKFQKDLTAGLHIDIGNSWSASWGDFDNDGDDDLFVPVNDLQNPNYLYINNGDGTFTKGSLPPITTDTDASISGTWGDYDNDGNLDLFVVNNINSNNKLYHNNGDGTFSRVENDPVVNLGTYSHGAAWADYNRDGHLDLVVTDFHPTDFNFLFKNDGQGGFAPDLSSPVSLSATSAVGVSWADFDNDLDPDLFIANTNGENNQLFRNDAGVLVAVTTGDIVNDGGSSVGGVWGDYDNDGDLDLFVTNASAIEPNFFYENDGDGTFTKITSGAIVESIGNSHGASWIDFDNDGDLDLIVANDQNQQNFFFANDGNKGFVKLTNAISNEQNDSYGTAWSDYDNDGDYDLFIANQGNSANDFFINEKGACTNHLIVKLQGCNSNSMGVGARVRVKADLGNGAIWQTKHVSTQTSAMGGQNSPKLLFGLSRAASVDSVIVYWPSGIVSEIANPGINQLLTIQEACGSKVCGVVFHDQNENGLQDAAELGIPNRVLLLQPGNFNVITDANGQYELYLDDGSYTLSLLADSNWTELSPGSGNPYQLSINLASQSEYCGNDFGNRALCPDPDLELQLGTTAFRRGLTNELLVQVSNSGSYDATGQISLDIVMTDNLYLVGGGWDSTWTGSGQRNYTYSWNGLPALSDTVLNLLDSVAVSAALGSVVNINASVSYSSTECSTGNNTNGMTENVVGSLDPNDKLVMIKGVGQARYASETERLLYKIRFQNLGTYAARIVEIIDTLSTDLDWESIEFESTSHPFGISMENGVITWRNPVIELPDSTSDPEGSQGYVSFSILPKQGLRPYTVIKNKASIQFDYNEALTTNETEMIVETRNIGVNGPSVLLYPNPTAEQSEVLLISDEQQLSKIEAIQVCDLQGRILLREQVGSSRATINVSGLTSGIYLLKVQESEGQEYYKRMSVNR